MHSKPLSLCQRNFCELIHPHSYAHGLMLSRSSSMHWLVWFVCLLVDFQCFQIPTSSKCYCCCHSWRWWWRCFRGCPLLWHGRCFYDHGLGAWLGAFFSTTNGFEFVCWMYSQWGSQYWHGLSQSKVKVERRRNKASRFFSHSSLSLSFKATRMDGRLARWWICLFIHVSFDVSFMIRVIVDWLIDEGHLYLTIDNHHAKSTSG